MTRLAPAAPYRPAAIMRLAALTPLDSAATAALDAAIADAVKIPVRREILTEGREITAMRLVVSGWAARVRTMPDGRRQFLSFLLPGDLIGMCRHPRPIAVSTVVALTDVMLCAAPSPAESPTLDRAYAISGALDEAYLLAHIARLGRLDAQERIADLLLELFERMELAGLTDDGGYDFPITQETFADMLGLTSVHVNRMVQILRRDGDIMWKGGRMRIGSPAGLARSIGRITPKVTAAA